MKKYIYLAAVALLLAGWGCAGRKAVPQRQEIPRIKPRELIDSLLAQDTTVHRVRLLGHGIYKQGKEKRGFRVGLVADRDEGKLGVYLSAGFVGVFALLWLCNPDSLCIYLPMQHYAMKEPVGYEIEGVILPPDAPVMVDMFSARTPLLRFVDHLKDAERTESGYYLTFKKDDQTLIVLAKPHPWHIEGYQWVEGEDLTQVVDVQFKNGKFQDGTWVPEKLVISQPALDQQIEVTIEKYLVNPEIADSLYFPVIPDDANWYRITD